MLLLYILLGIGIIVAIIVTVVLLTKHKKTSPPPDPKIEKFKKYLKEKLTLALKKNLSDPSQLDDPKSSWPNGTQFGIGIYIKNTPGNRGPVKQWATFCGGENATFSLCPNVNEEPSFFFGSGTKPITVSLVASGLFKLWKSKFPNKDPKEFLEWYGGPSNNRGAPGAATYKDIYNLANGFPKSNFYEVLAPKSNTQSGTGKSQTIKDWIYCCQSGSGSKCPAKTSLFCSNTCEVLRPVPLDPSFNSFTGPNPYCPDSICRWAWTNEDGTKATVNPNGVAFGWPDASCSCPIIQPNEYNDILQNLSVFNVGMMRSGIPDADSIWGLDTSSQKASRIHSIGPIEFVSEIIGFDWDPSWKNGKPVTQSWDMVQKDSGNYNGSIYSEGIPFNYGGSNTEPSDYPAAQYSSTAFTFLGSLLWLLKDSNGVKQWWEIDLNSFLPEPLAPLINFAGTSGNGGSNFMRTYNGERYYSYEMVVRKGGVIHSIPNDGIFGPKRTTLGGGPKAPGYKYKIRTANNPNGEMIQFYDWDAASGLMDGNAWGKASNMAEIYMNILSPNADNPVIDKEIQKEFVNEFINYMGPNWKTLYNNKLRAPWCAQTQAWSQNYTYNCGVMGPDWFSFTDKNPYDMNSSDYGTIPCYGHLGSTWGYNSCNVYFPGGTIKAYRPWVDDKNPNYCSNNDPKNWVCKKKNNNWTLTFKFCGGNEFTISCVQNSVLSESMGPVQQFLWEVIKDPFNWND